MARVVPPCQCPIDGEAAKGVVLWMGSADLTTQLSRGVAGDSREVRRIGC